MDIYCQTESILPNLPQTSHKIVINLKLQLRHSEPSAHADHRKRGHPVWSTDTHGLSVGITADRNPQSTQRLPQDLAFRWSSPGRVVQPTPQSQPRRAAPSTQARPGRPGATENGREQVTNPGQHVPPIGDAGNHVVPTTRVIVPQKDIQTHKNFTTPTETHQEPCQ